jgi:Lar family restriction alleviation protein
MSATTDELDLKPCPFCGESQNLSISTDVVMPDDFHGGHVSCGNCDAMGSDGSTLDGWLATAAEARVAAVNAWNRRA